jgi:hypothetical protein
MVYAVFKKEKGISKGQFSKITARQKNLAKQTAVRITC